MNKTLTMVLMVVVVVLIIAGIAYLAMRPAEEDVPADGSLTGVVLDGDNGNGAPDGGDDVSEPTGVVAYFQERMIALGVEEIDGQPIEGFDAQLLMDAFPGLSAADFNGVRTFEGHYEFRSGSLTFVRDQAQPVSSAERTISGEGYATLMANTATRLDILIDDRASVDELVQRLRG
jgi:hypothetical protein